MQDTKGETKDLQDGFVIVYLVVPNFIEKKFTCQPKPTLLKAICLILGKCFARIIKINETPFREWLWKD